MSKSKLHIAIVVLADKENLDLGKAHYNLGWGNSTVLGHTIKEVVKTQINDLYVVLGADYEEVFNRHKHFPVQFIKNSNWENNNSLELKWILSQINLFDLDGVLFLNALQPELDDLYIKEVIQTFEDQDKNTVTTSHNDQITLPALFRLNQVNEFKQTEPENWTSIFKSLEGQLVQIEPGADFYTISNLPEYLNKHNDWFGEVNPI